MNTKKCGNKSPTDLEWRQTAKNSENNSNKGDGTIVFRQQGMLTSDTVKQSRTQVNETVNYIAGMEPLATRSTNHKNNLGWFKAILVHDVVIRISR